MSLASVRDFLAERAPDLVILRTEGSSATVTLAAQAFGVAPKVIGVCPFGLSTPLAVYCDRSLLALDVVVPAAGSTDSAVRLAPSRLASLVEATWVDVAEESRPDP